MSNNIQSLFGTEVITRESHPVCVRVLREALAKAEAGEIVGAVICMIHHDQCTSFSIGGLIGGYGIIGAMEHAKADIIKADD